MSVVFYVGARGLPIRLTLVMDPVGEVLSVFREFGNRKYGESFFLTHLEHALRSADFAAGSLVDEETIVAALLRGE